jgi:hypothetical protein
VEVRDGDPGGVVDAGLHQASAVVPPEPQVKLHWMATAVLEL